ncbi:hypothetical protein TNCV_3483241 [Trichonephila clavipes]|nr:hypothetical protein TNCV_3483241 [Trichonephila clavipes]
MSSVFGDCSQQGLPPTHTQEPQVLDTIPRLKKKVRKTIGFKVIKPLDLSMRNCLPCIVDITPLLCLEIWVGGRIARVTYYKQDYPYTIIFESYFGVHSSRSFGKTVIVFTSHLDLTWDRGRVEILSSGSSSLSPSLKCISTSNYGFVYFGFYRLHSSCRRVREMVDVVGRLGNASRRQRPLAHGGSPTLEAGFEKTSAALA